MKHHSYVSLRGFYWFFFLNFYSLKVSTHWETLERKLLNYIFVTYCNINLTHPLENINLKNNNNNKENKNKQTHASVSLFIKVSVDYVEESIVHNFSISHAYEETNRCL